MSPPSKRQPCSVNVVLFGEIDDTRSSIINLISWKEVARVSLNVNDSTMRSTRYDISIDNMNFAIFDTVGLKEPQIGVNDYLRVIENAYELIVTLHAAGGIHLLLFCIRAGRLTATTWRNYKLFHESLCSARVPIAFVFTDLEGEVEMEDWWTRNWTYIRQYSIKSDGHACITLVQNNAPGDDKYTKSQKRIRELLKNYALKNEAFSLEPHSWLAKLGKGMGSFTERQRNPKKRDVMRVLTRYYKLDTETARKIADRIEKRDTERRVTIQNQQVIEGGGESNPATRVDGKEERVVSKDPVAEEATLSGQLGGFKVEHSVLSAEPHIDETRKRSDTKRRATGAECRSLERS